MGSTALGVSVYVCAIPQSEILTSNHTPRIPRCGSPESRLVRFWSSADKLSFSYSHHRILPSPFPAVKERKTYAGGEEEDVLVAEGHHDAGGPVERDRPSVLKHASYPHGAN